jgi:hypothetical protein
MVLQPNLISLLLTVKGGVILTAFDSNNNQKSIKPFSKDFVTN